MKQISVGTRIFHLADKTGAIIEKVCGAWCVICFAAMTLIAIPAAAFLTLVQLFLRVVKKALAGFAPKAGEPV